MLKNTCAALLVGLCVGLTTSPSVRAISIGSLQIAQGLPPTHLDWRNPFRNQNAIGGEIYNPTPYSVGNITVHYGYYVSEKDSAGRSQTVVKYTSQTYTGVLKPKESMRFQISAGNGAEITKIEGTPIRSN